MARILIVDDEEPLVNLLTDVLEDQGHTVCSAFGGRAALRLVQEHLPDLVISDVMMPQMDGLELCRHIRAGASTHAVPFVLMSAVTPADYRACGANDFVSKPFSLERIDAIVARYAYTRLAKG